MPDLRQDRTFEPRGTAVLGEGQQAGSGRSLRPYSDQIQAQSVRCRGMMLRVTLWMVRSGRHGEGENEALTAGIVGIGWADLGDLSDVGTTEDIRERAVEAHTAFTSKDVNATVRASRRHSAAGARQNQVGGRSGVFMLRRTGRPGVRFDGSCAAWQALRFASCVSIPSAACM